MKTYTVHLPADAQAGDRGALDRAVFVAEGFSWGAFFFTFLWFFYHRVWLAGLGVLVALIALFVLFWALDVSASAGTLAQILVHVLIGLEANSLRRWTLARRGRPAIDVVTGRDSDEAAMRAFGRLAGSGGEPHAAARGAAAQPSPGARYAGAPPVIGLFPDPEVRR